MEGIVGLQRTSDFFKEVYRRIGITVQSDV
jgi:hypothetical protein